MALRIRKKVKPYRQVEMADPMVMSNTYTGPYAKAMLAANDRRPDRGPTQAGDEA